MDQDMLRGMMDEVKAFFAGESSGHDYAHTLRVYRLATRIAEREGADLGVVQLAALLHDVDDVKLSPATHAGKDHAVALMRAHDVAEATIRTVCAIIEEVSFVGDDTVAPASIEGQCVQDADRLDAIGAIGIARAFAYGGHHNRAMHDPDERPNLHMTRDEYRRHVSTSVNHFYEKLFRLKDLMNTQTAREIAAHRDRFMHEYIDEFLLEWDGAR